MRRPDVFTLDYSHPLAQGLVFGLASGGQQARDCSLLQHRVGHNGGWNHQSFANGRQTLPFYDIAGQYLSTNPDVVRNATQLTLSTLFFSDIKSTEFRRISDGFSQQKWQIVQWNTNSINCSVGTAAGSYTLSIPSSAWSSQKWHHLSLTYDGVLLRLYFDGFKLSELFINSPLGTSTTAGHFISIGATNLGTQRWKGQLADFIIHNRALSPAEIALLADRTDPMLGGLVVEERPVLYFDFGGGEPTEDKIGPFAITVDSSLGLGGLKGAKGSVSIDHEAAIHASGSKSAKGSTVFPAGAAFLAGGVISQSDDKLGAAIFVDESAVGIGGIKKAFGSFAITNASTFGVGGTTGVFMPELSQASGAAVSSGGIDGSVYTNKNTGTLYAVATLSSTKPSVAQVQAGQNHLGAAAKYSTSQSVTTYGLQAVQASGLASYTEHYWHFQHKDAGGLDSTVITSPAVRTLDISIPLAFSDTAPATLLSVQVWSKVPKKADVEGLY